jgi:hypothetical protein
MKSTIDNERYDSYARSFLATLTKYLEHGLTDTDLSDKEKKDLARSLTFSIASPLDGTGSLEHDQKQLIPYLAFELDGEDSAVIDDGTIALHELCELE